MDGLHRTYCFSFPIFQNLTLNLITSVADSKALVTQLTKPLFNVLSLVLKGKDIGTHRYPIAFLKLYLPHWQQFGKVNVNNVKVMLTCNRAFCVSYSKF